MPSCARTYGLRLPERAQVIAAVGLQVPDDPLVELDLHTRPRPHRELGHRREERLRAGLVERSGLDVRADGPRVPCLAAVEEAGAGDGTHDVAERVRMPVLR